MIESEKILIAHAIKHPEYATEILEGLEPSDFSSPKNRAIYQAISKNIEKYDLLILQNALKSQGWELPVSELIELEEQAFEGIDLSRCKEEMREASKKKDLSQFAEKISKDLENPDSDLQAIQEEILQKVSDLGIRPISGKDLIKRPSDFLTEIQAGQERASAPILTGLSNVDGLLGGFRHNELTVVTGETGSGKSTFAAANLPFNLSQNDHPCLIASFEMKPAVILRKMVQMVKGRPFNELCKGEVEDAFDFISELPVFFVNVYGEIGLRELKRCVYHAHSQYGIEIAILDHLHFFLKYNADHERQAIDSALRDIKCWAMDLGIHILLIVHPTKIEIENRPIRLNDLKGSSGLKQIPDNVLSIWRPRGEDDSKKPQNEVILYVLKCRDDAGGEGKVILTFDKRLQSYSDSGHGEASPSEGKGFSHPSPSVRPGRDWANGSDS